MASSEQTSSRSGLGWLPKLVLWSAVIGFGYVYLNSVDQEGGATKGASLLESVAKLSPIPLSAFPGASKDESGASAADASVEGQAVVSQADADAAKGAAQEPVHETESAVFAKSLMKDEGGAASSAQKLSAPLQAPATYASMAAHKPVVESKPQPAPAASAGKAVEQAPAQVAASPSAPAESRRMPHMPQPQASMTQTPRMPSMPRPPAAVAQSSPSAGAAAEPVPQSQPAMSGGWESMQEQRAQMIAQYEAMRREADERMRQYWARMRESMPAMMPYGYPSYGTGYAPGYAPGVYAPPR